MICIGITMGIGPSGALLHTIRIGTIIGIAIGVEQWKCTISPSIHCSRGVYLPGGVTCPKGVYLPRGMYLQGGVPEQGGLTCQGGYLPRGVNLPGGYLPRGVNLPGGVPAQGGLPARGGTCQGTPPIPPVNRMTDRSKNITLPQTSFAGGNNYDCYNFLL